MDIQSILEQFKQAGAELPAQIQGGKLLSDGPNSIVLEPFSAPDHVLKIIKPGRIPCGNNPSRELELLRLISGLENDSVVTPHPVTAGSEPDHILMTKIGTPINWQAQSISENHKIGLAIGAFAAQLFDKHQCIHCDLRDENVVATPDGRIGLIDIASLVPGKRPAEMLHMPILGSTGFATGIAEGFMRNSTAKMDLFWFEATHISLLADRLYDETPEKKAHIRQISARNLEHLNRWRAQIRGTAASPT